MNIYFIINNEKQYKGFVFYLLQKETSYIKFYIILNML